VGSLSVDCQVPYLLDAAQAGNAIYMGMHFADLVQQYCIRGTIAGEDLTAFPEKMYYGTHSAADELVSLNQSSMQSLLDPRFAVRVDFYPDRAVLPGSRWEVGADAQAVVLRHVSARELCLLALGTSGELEITAAANTTAPEGGSFSVQGTLELADPRTMGESCELFADAGLPCCP
jgi:hypothetical protein